MLLNVNNILFATDLSKNADYALRLALTMSKAHGADIHVLHVAEPLSLDANVTLRLFMQTNALAKESLPSRRDSAKEVLLQNQKDFVESLSDEEKEAYNAVKSVEIVEGHPAESILNRATQLDCDVIVMASHEQSTAHTFLGTVVKRVLRRSNTPVLVVPHPANG